MQLTFVITNDRHHQAMMWPVAQALSSRHRLHLLSFAEFRGMDTPVAAWRDIGASVCRVPPRNLRPRPQAAETLMSLGSSAAGSRSRLQALVWHGVLRHLVRIRAPHLVVLPNDSAYPGNYLVARLLRAGIPFVLVQEGIRFPLPGEANSAYGSGGAAAIACWGKRDVDYFASLGVSRERLHAVGNARYDAILAQDRRGDIEALRIAGALPLRYLLFAANPIDDQGFCDTETKYQAFRAFASQALPVLEARGIALALKLHGRESEAGYRRVLGPVAEQIAFVGATDVHTVLAGAEAVVVWASTVGLEGLLQGRPLGVLETPGHGHVFDYVDAGAALPLTPGPTLPAALERLLADDVAQRRRALDYLDHRMACRGRSTSAVTELVESTLQRHAV